MLEHFLLPELHRLRILRKTIFQQDRAGAHTSTTVRDLMQENFSKRVISRKCDVPWPPKLLDLTAPAERENKKAQNTGRTEGLYRTRGCSSTPPEEPASQNDGQCYHQITICHTVSGDNRHIKGCYCHFLRICHSAFIE